MACDHPEEHPTHCDKCGMKFTPVWIEGKTKTGRAIKVLAAPDENCQTVHVICVDGDRLQ